MNSFACVGPRAVAWTLSSTRNSYVFLRHPPSHITSGFVVSSPSTRHAVATLKTTPHWLEECSRVPNSGPGNRETRNACREDVSLVPLDVKEAQSVEPSAPGSRHPIQAARDPTAFGSSVAPGDIIRSRHHDLIKHVLRLKSRRRYRWTCKEIVVLGAATLRDICSLHPETGAEDSDVHPADHSDAGIWKPEASVLLTDCAAVASNAESFGLHAAKTRLVTREVMNIVLERREPGYSAVSGVRGKAPVSELAPSVTRSQTVGIFKQPQPCEAFQRPRFVLAFDRLRYVGNLGILLRCAGVMGVDAFFFVDGTADPFNWKTLEISRGLHCHLPYQWGSPSELVQLCERHKLLPVVADVSGDRVEILHDRAAGYEGICCILGSESHGPSELIRQRAIKVAFPMAAYVESLNVGVAGGLMLSSLRIFLGRAGQLKSTI